MNKIYYLSSCSTCVRIMRQFDTDKFELREIKQAPISAEELDQMKEMSGSYEALFSRRAQKYKQMELSKKQLTESDYRSLILQEYTFLKRPVMIINDKIFVGNAAKTVEQALLALVG